MNKTTTTTASWDNAIDKMRTIVSPEQKRRDEETRIDLNRRLAAYAAQIRRQS